MEKIYQYPLKIDKQIIDELRTLSKQQGRSLNKQIEFILRQYLLEQNQNAQKNNQSSSK